MSETLTEAEARVRKELMKSEKPFTLAIALLVRQQKENQRLRRLLERAGVEIER